MNIFKSAFRCNACLHTKIRPHRVTSNPSWQPHIRAHPARFYIIQQRQHSGKPISRTGNPADDDPSWQSILEQEPTMVRVREKHGIGIWFLAIIPLTAFVLGTWQIQRLQQKSELIARLEDQLVAPPLPLPPKLDISQIPAFDHRRVVLKGKFRHDQEMLIGPRMRDGEQGYLVITPLQREDGTKILVNRGWISKAKRDQSDRNNDVALPKGLEMVMGLLRQAPKKNMFTPDNKPGRGEWYFLDVKEMAAWVGADEVLIEETMEPELFELIHRTNEGIPIGRPPKLQLNNRHVEYIVTWYGVAIATSIMWILLYRKKPNKARPGEIVKMSHRW